MALVVAVDGEEGRRPVGTDLPAPPCGSRRIQHRADGVGGFHSQAWRRPDLVAEAALAAMGGRIPP